MVNVRRSGNARKLPIFTVVSRVSVVFDDLDLLLSILSHLWLIILFIICSRVGGRWERIRLRRIVRFLWDFGLILRSVCKMALLHIVLGKSLFNLTLKIKV